MKRIAKWTGIFLAVVILTVVCLPFLIHVDQFRPTLQSELSRALGREVTLGNLRLKILQGQVTADDLSVAEDPAFGKPAFIKAQALHVGVELWPFIMSRKLIVTNLTLDQPDIELVQAPSGNWNFSSLGGKSTTPSSSSPSSARMPLDLSVQLVRVTNGRLEEFQKSMEEPAINAALSGLGEAHGYMGKQQQSRAILKRLETLSRSTHMSPPSAT